MARIEKLQKDKTEEEKNINNRKEQKNELIKKYEAAWSVWKEYRQ